VIGFIYSIIYSEIMFAKETQVSLYGIRFNTSLVIPCKKTINKRVTHLDKARNNITLGYETTEGLLFMSMGSHHVSELWPPMGLLYIPQVIYECGEQWWNDDRLNPKKSEKTPSQCHSVHHKSHVD
jgi:hypothetical protein